MANSVDIHPATCVREQWNLIGVAVKPAVVEMRLNRREVRRLEVGAEGVQVVCMGGVLWVTQDGDHEDHFLCAGERFTATRPGPVVVQGMGRDAR